MDKTYNPKQVEDAIYKAWEDSGYFTPENLPNTDARKEAFSIVLPPPNVTGTLHMGHAVMLAIEDAIVRYQRMSGKKALWIPGTDHAAVATESKVEKILIDEGTEKPKEALGREAFLDRVKAFAQDSHDTIVGQAKKMGASLDWSREAYTLDDARSLAVRTAFTRMYDDGLIYRGYRVVNWSVKGQSTCSDDELVYVDRPAKLYTFKYAKNVPIPIATTRPETKLGDTAIAVHPEGRWKEYIGQEFVVENFGQEGHTLRLKVFGDEAVDDDFGTGALGVTTAHSMIDFEMYERQKALGNDIGLIQVIGEDGKMMNAGPEYNGLSVKEAKEKIANWLETEGLLENVEEMTQNAGTSDRFKDVVEPLPKTQWFVNVNKEFTQDGRTVTLKLLMQEAVREKKIEILPARFEKTYFHWIDSLRDWCISRQIWFGHQIPAWHKNGEVHVGIDAPEGDGWTQDPDTLDTWFSAGLWTFSALGWPDEEADDLKTYHPTQLLETGYDILFFWVARMILMSTYLRGEVPFKTVYLHGLVRDEQGRKMSKSLGNILNPLDTIEEYGADATRLALVIGSSPGNDMKLSMEKIAGYRNFTNKLWNIARFVLTSADKIEIIGKPEPKTLADRWILGRLSEVTEKVTGHLDKYELSLYGETLRDFTWTEFADWYLELSKGERNDEVLLHVLDCILRLWHPLMPFVTEEIYKQFGEDMLIVAEWPKTQFTLSDEDRTAMDDLQSAVTTIRRFRSENDLAPSKVLRAMLPAELEGNSEAIARLVRIENMNSIENAAELPYRSGMLKIDVKGIDFSAQKARLETLLHEKQNYVKQLEGRLSNASYVKNAPEELVQKTREELEEAKMRAKEIAAQLNSPLYR
ncbi:MAG: valine--tRNA ligase [bacterium]|nr:valine--tRNA ligase [bacterium]